MAPPRQASLLQESEKDKLANDLAVPFERGGVVSVPYGSICDYSWVGIWQIDTRPEWQTFEERMTRSTVAEFEDALRKLVHRLYEDDQVVDTQLCKLRPGELEVFCLSAKFPGAERLHLFQEEELPSYRREFKILWSSHRAPIEFTISSQTASDRPRGRSAKDNNDSQSPPGDAVLPSQP